MHPGVRRALAVVCLVALLTALVVTYSAGAPTHVTSVSSHEAVTDSDGNVGERVAFWARANAVDGDTLTLRFEDATVTVVGVDADVDPGDVIQVAGTIRSDGTVAADRVVVAEGERRPWLYGVSAAGLALVAGLFFRSWTLAPNRLAFVPREDEDA
jgi:hypothetical protein